MRLGSNWPSLLFVVVLLGGTLSANVPAAGQGCGSGYGVSWGYSRPTYYYGWRSAPHYEYVYPNYGGCGYGAYYPTYGYGRYPSYGYGTYVRGSRGNYAGFGIWGGGPR